MHTVILDLTYENSIDELYQQFAKTDISFSVLDFCGLGGGWPECQLEADVETLREWLLENYCDEGDIQYHLFGES